jgi:microcystin degradation protein MlrC
MVEVRIGIARLWHESNSFPCSVTEVSDFLSYQDGILVGEEVLSCLERRDEVTGFAKVLNQNNGTQIAPLFSAGALPSGLLTEETAAYFEDLLRRELRRAGRLDGVCLALHGATSSTAFPDFDGHFLKVVREEVGQDIPIVCALDCHAVVTGQMLDLSTALISYRTHPHVDEMDTGVRVANMLLDTLQGKIRPKMACQRIPLLLPPSDEGTHTGATKELFDAVIATDQIDRVIACSLCPGYAWQDVPEQGWTVLAVTDDDHVLAQRIVQSLSQQVWEARFSLLPRPMLSPKNAIRQAAATDGCPVIVTDSADVIGAGADGDTTALLKVLLEERNGVDGLILCHIPDPEAVSVVKALDVGATVTVAVGGKRDRHYSRPVTVTGEILCTTEGPISDDGQFGSEPTIETGAIVCLGVDNIRLVLSERVILGPQPSLFRKVGIEPFEAKIVTLKTGVGFNKTYGHVAKSVIRANCPGASSYDLAGFDFKRVPRTIFPLDRNADWQSVANAGIHTDQRD